MARIKAGLCHCGNELAPVHQFCVFFVVVLGWKYGVEDMNTSLLEWDLNRRPVSRLCLTYRGLFAGW